MKHIEMIIDYVTDGSDYQYNDNHGLLVRCKDCKYFEYDHVEKLDGIPLIVAHEICTRWSDGVKTSENGYCFLGERGEQE